MKKNVLWLIIACGFLLRIISLNQSFWLDEAIGAIAVHDYSYSGIITDYIKGDTHPPLYYLTLKFWTSLFGYSEIAMRILSVILGTVTLYVVYMIAKEVSNSKGSKFPAIAALLFATAPLHVYYSQEVRMYAMNTLLASLLVLTFLRNDFKKFSLVLLITAMTDYLPLLVGASLWVYAILEKKNFDWWKMFVISHIPAFVFLLLWLPTFLIQSAGSREALQLFPGWGDLIGKAGIKELVLVWVKFLLGRISFESNFIYASAIFLFSIAYGVFLLRGTVQLNKTKLFSLWLSVPIVVAFIGSIFVPGFSYFRMIIALPALYLLAAYGVSQFKNAYPYAGILVALNLLFSCLYLFNQQYHREDWRGSVSYVANSARENDIVIQLFPEPFAGYQWYAKGINIPSYGATQKLGATGEEIGKNVEDKIQNASGVFYYEYLHDQTDPNGVTKQVLEENNFQQRSVTNFRGVGFVEYWSREK